MPAALVHHSGAVIDLAALHDALGCAAMAAVQAFRGDEDSAVLSLIEAHEAAEEAFGPGSPGLDAFSAVLDAITQASPEQADRSAGTPRPASEPLPL